MAGSLKKEEMLVIECEWLALSRGDLEEGPFFVTVEGDSITAVQRERPEAEKSLQWLQTHLLTPGFIDLHTHGVGQSQAFPTPHKRESELVW